MTIIVPRRIISIFFRQMDGFLQILNICRCQKWVCLTIVSANLFDFFFLFTETRTTARVFKVSL